MKLIQSLEDLQSWESYKEFSKQQLKLLEKPEPCFVSKEKVAFEIAGKPWNGIALLAGPKAALCMRQLKKEGVLFREGTCGREGKELRVEGLEPKHLKGAARTLKKLLLGYKIAGVEDDGEEGDAAAPAPAAPDAPDARARRVQELQKLSADLGRLLSALNR